MEENGTHERNAGIDVRASPQELREGLVTLLPRLRRFARALTRDAHDADDLVQIAVERALTRAGHPTLRFDYRGVGASRGVSGQRAGSERIEHLREEVADLHRICEHLLATTRMSAACAVGYSFGAAVALEAAEDPRIARLVLIAPPTAIYDFAALAAVRKPLLVVCAQHDRYSARGALKLPEGATLEVIAHADHFFARGLTELGKTVASWLRGERPELVAPEDAASTGTKIVELDPGDGEPLELDVDPE